jgi:hypothetical protein
MAGPLVVPARTARCCYQITVTVRGSRRATPVPVTTTHQSVAWFPGESATRHGAGPGVRILSEGGSKRLSLRYQTCRRILKCRLYHIKIYYRKVDADQTPGSRVFSASYVQSGTRTPSQTESRPDRFFSNLSATLQQMGLSPVSIRRSAGEPVSRWSSPDAGASLHGPARR